MCKKREYDFASVQTNIKRLYEMKCEKASTPILIRIFEPDELEFEYNGLFNSIRNQPC